MKQIWVRVGILSEGIFWFWWTERIARDFVDDGLENELLFVTESN